jgi:23S rRNA (adenine-N6)-dimethyltransferase
VPGSGRSGRGWGWHPLVEDWAELVVSEAAIRAGELVLDIGAGEGAITAALLERGATVIAVELHPRRAATLRKRFADADVRVLEVDAASLRLPSRPFRVVASPPYAISTALLRNLLRPGSRMVSADLVLQRAVVRRYAQGRGAGAERWLERFDVRRGRSLPRSAFRRRPQVDSSVLVIRRRRPPRAAQRPGPGE